MPTAYLATPAKGRVGKSRQVEPIKFTIDGPHKSERIAEAITKGFYKYCYHAYVVFEFPTVTQMVAQLYNATSHNHLATIAIDEIEE